MRMQQDSTYENSSMVKVIALCRQPIYYLNKTWHMSMSPYVVTRPHWANFVENAMYLPVYLVCAVPYLWLHWEYLHSWYFQNICVGRKIILILEVISL